MELLEFSEVGIDFSNLEPLSDYGIPELADANQIQLPQKKKRKKGIQPEKLLSRLTLRISMSKLGNRSIRLVAEYKDSKFNQFLIEKTEVGPYTVVRTEVFQADCRRRSLDYFEAASQFNQIRNDSFPPAQYGNGKVLSTHIDIL